MTSRFTSTERLWVCHRCEMIGEQDEAERHIELKGHRVDRLSQEISDGIRAEWRANRFTEEDFAGGPTVHEMAGPSWDVDSEPRYRHLRGRERQEAIRESNQRAGGDPYGG